MWRWNVTQMDLTCVVYGKLVGIQLHSKEALSGLHFQFHDWNVEVFVDQHSERREGGHSGGDHHEPVVHIACGEKAGSGRAGCVRLQVFGVAQMISVRVGPRLFVHSHDHGA